jgi:Zn ribbon nucleic-acid-binding protein
VGTGRIRDQQEKWLQEMVEKGAACPFCNSSSSLQLGTKLEVPHPPERGGQTRIREPRPEAFMRVECSNCGYVSLFKSRFPV